MKTQFRRVLQVAVLGTMSLASASAGTVFVDDFEGATLGAPPGVGILNWTLAPGGGNMDVIGPGLGGLTCHSGTKCVDTDGTSSAANAVLSRTFSVTAGVTYFLGFWYSGSQRTFLGPDSIRVDFGSAAPLTINTAQGASTWTQDTSLSFVAGASGTATVSFTNLTGPDNVGVLIDDITVTDNAAAGIPEPATLALIGSGLAAIGLRRRK